MARMRLKFSVLSVILLSSGCASIDNDELELEEVSTGTQPTMDNNTTSGLWDYNVGGKKGKLEWIGCSTKPGPSSKSFLLLSYDSTVFQREKFCSEWLAQTFLKAGYNVLGVNLPGQGQSQPLINDFYGPQTVSALQQGLAPLAKNLAWQKLSGIWAYSTSTIVAGFLAKRVGSLERLILGAGVYDLEVANGSAGSGVQKEIAAGLATEPDSSAFFEKRSLAWDTSSLPKSIFLYHGKKDKFIDEKQTSALRDTLASGEYQVKMQLFDEFGHDLKTEQHQAILTAILKPGK